MADFTVTGADDMLRLSKRLKEAGSTDLRKNLHKRLRNTAKPLTKKTSAALRAGAPSGLRSRAARTKQRVALSTGGSPGLRIQVRYGSRGGGLSAANARMLNRTGELRHPLYGNRDHWYTTRAPGATGWFDDTLHAEAPLVRRELRQAMVDTLADIKRGV